MAEDDVEFAVRTIDESTAAMKEISGSYDGLIGNVQNAGDAAEKTTGQLDDLGKKTGEADEQNKKTGMSAADLAGAMQIVGKALDGAEKAYDATIGKALTYGETIRNLSVISGQSAEDTSRMVQVLDDWQVSAADVEAATRKMTANGLAPSLDTIATLGEEYRKITDAEEKNKFVTDNLGRSGQAWNQVLGQTREQLMAASQAVNENLVLNQRQIAELDQLRLVQDGVADTWDSIFISLGTKGAPIMANWLTMIDNASKGQGSWQERIQRTNGLAIIPAIDWMLQYSDATNQNVQALQAATEAEKLKGEATMSAAEADRIAAENATIASATYTTIMGLQGQIVGQQTSYAESTATVAAQQDELNAKIAEAVTQYGANSSQVATLQEQYGALGDKQTELADKNEEATTRIIAQAAIAKLAADGWTEAEFAKAQQIQVGLGLITQAQADEAIKINDLTTAVADGTISVGEFNQAVRDGSLDVQKMKETESKTWSNYSDAIVTSLDTGIGKIDDYISKLTSIPTTINTNFTQSGTIPSPTEAVGGQSTSGGGTVVNNYIENAYFDGNNSII
jgi:hypothetical protein